MSASPRPEAAPRLGAGDPGAAAQPLAQEGVIGGALADAHHAEPGLQNTPADAATPAQGADAAPVDPDHGSAHPRQLAELSPTTDVASPGAVDGPAAASTPPIDAAATANFGKIVVTTETVVVDNASAPFDGPASHPVDLAAAIGFHPTQNFELLLPMHAIPQDHNLIQVHTEPVQPPTPTPVAVAVPHADASPPAHGTTPTGPSVVFLVEGGDGVVSVARAITIDVAPAKFEGSAIGLTPDTHGGYTLTVGNSVYVLATGGHLTIGSGGDVLSIDVGLHDSLTVTNGTPTTLTLPGGNLTTRGLALVTTSTPNSGVITPYVAASGAITVSGELHVQFGAGYSATEHVDPISLPLPHPHG